MTTAVDVLLIVFLVVAIIACIYLIISLKKITTSVVVMEEDFHELKTKTTPILDKLDEASEKALAVTAEAEAQFKEIKATVQNYRNKLTNLLPSGKSSQSLQNTNPINDLVRNLTAIGKGVGKFWREYKK